MHAQSLFWTALVVLSWGLPARADGPPGPGGPRPPAGAGLYARQLLEDADLNDDGYLTPDEVKEAGKEFAYFALPEVAAQLDPNGDGIEISEDPKLIGKWMMYRHQQTAKAIAALKQKYPDGNFEDFAFLKSHPDVLQALLANEKWVEDHEDLVEKLLADADFVGSAEYVVPLLRNRRWVDAHLPVVDRWYTTVVGRDANWLWGHPDVARELWSNRGWVGRHAELGSEFFAHRDWFEAHPDVGRRVWRNGDLVGHHPGLAGWAHDNPGRTRWEHDHPRGSHGRHGGGRRGGRG